VAFLLHRIRASIDPSRDRTTSGAVEAISFRETFSGGPFDDQFNGLNGEVAPPIAGPIPAPTSNEYIYKQDIPWDWAHRFPPGYFGSPAQPSSSAPAMAYVPGCARQTVTVPGADGKDQTVNVVRC
jgi:hypothetical protein